MTDLTTLDAFLAALRQAPRAREAYEDILSRASFDIEAIRDYCHFDPSFYTRNLIERNDDFELLTLCWSVGQVSPIHDHAGSDGWIRGMDGECEEVWYQLEAGAGDVPKVTRGRAAKVTAGVVSYINDDMAWHTVGNASDAPAVSLHLYSPPIDACQYIDASTGRVESRTMSYTSKFGALV